METHHLQVHRTARYLTEGPIDPGVKEVWFLLHGYRQLAGDFLTYCQALHAPSRYLVAPEGLSRFYVAPPGDRIGASWMTREERDHEIEDYVAYLDAVYDAVFARFDRGAVRVRVLGFSQGVATSSRWVARGSAKIDQLVMWGERLPPEFDDAHATDAFGGIELHMVIGNTDPLVSPGDVETERTRYERLKLPVRFHTFEGGHRIHKDTLAAIANI